MADQTKPEDNEADTPWQTRVARIESKAARETLKSLGFDVDDVNEMQADALFLRKLRKSNEAVNAKVIAGAIGLFFTLAGALATLAFQNFMPKG